MPRHGVIGLLQVELDKLPRPRQRNTKSHNRDQQKVSSTPDPVKLKFIRTLKADTIGDVATPRRALHYSVLGAEMRTLVLPPSTAQYLRPSRNTETLSRFPSRLVPANTISWPHQMNSCGLDRFDITALSPKCGCHESEDTLFRY